MFQLLQNTFWLLLVLIFSLSCARAPKMKEPKTDEECFNRAMRFYRERNHWQGIPAFQEVRDKFPLSHYAILAELRLADLHYFKSEFVEAVHYYEEFKRLHPSNPHVPYSIFQMGMCYFKQIESIDRDQTPAKKAANYFEYLIDHNPTNPFTGKAMGKLKICRKKIFEHEFYIGNFYYKTKKYLAAKERFSTILTQHPYAREKDKVLFYLGQTYQHLNEKDKARDTLFTLIENYPQSEYSAQAKLLLGLSLESEEKDKLGTMQDKKQFIIF